MTNILTPHGKKAMSQSRRLSVWAMVFALTPLVAFLWGKHEVQQKQYQDVLRIYSQPVAVALPKELPSTIYDF